MADSKVSELTALTAANVASDDAFYVVDTSATTTGSKQITTSELQIAVNPGTLLTATGVAATDTAALQAAFTAASDGDVLLLRGDFVTDAALAATVSGVTIRGHGATITQATTTTKTINVSSDRVTIEGIHFIGLGTEDPWDGTSYNGVAGVFINGVDHVTVDRCRFTNHAGASVMVDNSCDGLRVTNNTIAGMGSGVISAGENGSDAGIRSSETGDTKDATLITGNNISGHAFGLLLQNGDGVVINDNVIHDIPGQHGMYITQGGDMTINGNVVIDCEDIGIKIQNKTAADNEAVITISGNSIARVGEAGISVALTAPNTANTANNVSITANNIYDAGTHGMYLTWINELMVAGNRIRKCANSGISCSNSSGSMFANRISLTQHAAMVLSDMHGTFDVDDTVITDCPLNADGGVGKAEQSVIYLADNVVPHDGIISIGDVSMRFYNGTPKTGTGLLAYAIYSTADTDIVFRGEYVNEVSHGDTLLGTVEYQNTSVVTCADTEAPSKSLYYSSDQSALTYKDSSGVLRNAAPLLFPSGDASGVEDRTNIQAAISSHGYACLAEGSFVVDTSITLTYRNAIYGQGFKTALSHVDGSTATILCKGTAGVQATQIVIADMLITAGNYNIEIDGTDHASGATRVMMRNLNLQSSVSHGIYGHGGTWTNWITDCSVGNSGGDGVHFISDVSGVHGSNGNALAVSGLDATGNTGNGLTWGATGLSVVGSHFEDNVIGVKIVATEAGPAVSGFSLIGNYYENNTGNQIEIETAATKIVTSGVISGGRLTCATSVNGIYCHGTALIYDLIIDRSFYMYGAGDSGKYLVNMGSQCIKAHVTTSIGSYLNCTNPESNTLINAGAPALPVHSMTDGTAYDRSIYYSSTQSALCYKNASGVVTTIDQTAT